MDVFGPGRRAAVGAALGVGITLLAGALGGPARDYLPYAAALLLGIALVGLVLGAAAATWAFAASVVLLSIYAIVAPDGILTRGRELIPLALFLAGSPVVIFLMLRLEATRQVAAEALAASHDAQRQAAAERERSEAARHDLDAALAAAERERTSLEEVAEAIPEPLVVYDEELRGTYGNRAALRLFGRSFVERDIDDWARAAAPRDEHGVALERDEWPQVRAQREAFRARLTLRVPMSGRDVIVDAEGTPIPGGGAVLMLRDVGKEEEQRRRLSRFASFVAHELRNPLAVAKARIELAQRDANLPRRTSGHVARALESVDAAIGILERLELYSRADSGRVEARTEDFALAPAVGAAVERLRARGGDREVRTTMPPDVVVRGDRHLSEQAITNLLTNADRYSTPGTPIHVDVATGEQVTLRVRDEGPGIDDEVAERLFRDRVAAGRGLGLGLYLVNATMAAMGGSVELEQRTPGAVFALRWVNAGEPVAAATGEVTPESGDVAAEAPSG